MDKKNKFITFVLNYKKYTPIHFILEYNHRVGLKFLILCYGLMNLKSVTISNT